MAQRVRVVLMGASLTALLPLPTAGPDSLRIPDQPYRYLSSTTAPTSARQQFPSTQSIININTAEWRPQAFLLVQRASLVMTNETAQLNASITPVSLPTPVPPDAVPLGNAYALEVRDQDGRVLEPSGKGENPVVQLRIPMASIPGHVVLELHAHAGWSALRTIRTADVIYAAELPSFGTVVAVYLVTAPATVTASRHMINYGWALLSAGLIIVIVMAGCLALWSQRRSTSHG